MTPMRAIMVGPPRLATNISASIAACHSGSSASALASSVDVIRRVAQASQLAAARRCASRPRGMPSSLSAASQARSIAITAQIADGSLSITGQPARHTPCPRNIFWHSHNLPNSNFWEDLAWNTSVK